MKPYKANLLNSLVLIVIGLWGYFSSESPSLTALIPVFAGAILLVFTPWFKNGNKVIAHIAVTLTLILFISLLKPLTGSIARHDNMAVTRVIIMMLSSFFTMIIFIKSFIDARIKRN